MKRSFRSVLAPMAGLALGASVLAGCSTGSTEATDAPDPETESQVDDGAFPVTIEHAFGETTIEEEPTRVATLGWTDQDMALSLGVVPVGATKLTWGGNEGGSSDWFDAEVEELGAEAPVRYDDADGAPVEEVAKLAPDLILATNSGITEKEYTKLSKIAPVVAYPDAPWITPWQDALDLVGQALGRSTLAAEVEAETQTVIDDAKKEYAGIQGKSLIFAYLTPTDLSTIGVYSPQDPRVSLMNDFGLVNAPVVEKSIERGAVLRHGLRRARRHPGVRRTADVRREPRRPVDVHRRPAAGSDPGRGARERVRRGGQAHRPRGDQPEPAVDSVHRRELPAPGRPGG